MKSIKTIISVLVLLFALNVQAQKIKLKKGNVLVDGITWLTYDGCKMFDAVCSLYNSEGDEIIYFKMVSVAGEEPITTTNKDGSLKYIEVIFLGLDKRFEVNDKTYRGIVKVLHKSKVVNSDGTINIEKTDRLIEKYGTEFSDRLKNKSTIIINEKSNSSGDGSGINIKIGN